MEIHVYRMKEGPRYTRVFQTETDAEAWMKEVGGSFCHADDCPHCLERLKQDKEVPVTVRKRRHPEIPQ